MSYFSICNRKWRAGPQWLCCSPWLHRCQVRKLAITPITTWHQNDSPYSTRKLMWLAPNSYHWERNATPKCCRRAGSPSSKASQPLISTWKRSAPSGRWDPDPDPVDPVTSVVFSGFSRVHDQAEEAILPLPQCPRYGRQVDHCPPTADPAGVILIGSTPFHIID